MNWFIYAIFGMLAFSAMLIIFKQLSIMGLKPALILVFVFGFGMLLYLAHLIITKSPLNVNINVIILLGIAAFLSYIGNFFYVAAIDLAPNPGFAIAIVGFQAVLVTIASVFLFASEFSLVNVVGVVLALIGIILIGL